MSCGLYCNYKIVSFSRLWLSRRSLSPAPLRSGSGLSALRSGRVRGLVRSPPGPSRSPLRSLGALSRLTHRSPLAYTSRPLASRAYRSRLSAPRSARSSRLARRPERLATGFGNRTQNGSTPRIRHTERRRMNGPGEEENMPQTENTCENSGQCLTGNQFSPHQGVRPLSLF